MRDHQRPEEARDTKRYEAQLNKYVAVGHAAEAEDLAKLFYDRAGKRFAKGKDDEARLLRGLAKELEERGRKHRQRQEECEARIAALATTEPEEARDE